MKKIANIGEDLIDLWNYVNGVTKKDEIKTDNIKDSSTGLSTTSQN